MLQLLELRSSTIGRAARLVILCFELLIFQTNQHLTFLDLIALLDADPGNTAGDLGISFDSVMRNNVAGCGQDNTAANVATLRCRANYFRWKRPLAPMRKGTDTPASQSQAVPRRQCRQ